jgi:hypothetical protein
MGVNRPIAVWTLITTRRLFSALEITASRNHIAFPGIDFWPARSIFYL